MNVNSLNTSALPLQSSTAPRPLENARNTNEIQGPPNITDPLVEAPQSPPVQPPPETEENLDFQVSISQEARATLSADEQTSGAAPTTEPTPEPVTEPPPESGQLQQEQLQQQQTVSAQPFTATPASPYAPFAQGPAAESSIDIIV